MTALGSGGECDVGNVECGSVSFTLVLLLGFLNHSLINLLIVALAIFKKKCIPLSWWFVQILSDSYRLASTD